MGLEEQREIAEAEAVSHWYSTIFQPALNVIENSSILKEFPDRMPADLYLWVMDHLHYLRDRPGWEEADAASAAKDFVESLSEEKKAKNRGAKRNE